MGVGDSKYAVIFDPLQTDHVVQRMRNVRYNGRLHGNMHAWLNIGHVHQNISVTVTDTKKVSMNHL